ncbi:phosphoribosylaminoimidazolesuccinocarboxamide synthase [Edaphobacillus lindanitolerans]|uniref:phosphoribosylaminoimidazolesuccinocarboxamide synthase n=1 Tax=Edaphobacillus lindanitolerans TaxID=550447 RepID=A0A1U7PRS5_9BACI|nr:phosphoribosylaminoimidazolesuccinocarboxamide synthase [Edaphobacillus lindanitolerans]SIT88611.1 phosphoribosylaminoimidazole-succinocarboxamide synthase [Edaphobacillus lindanitolerans]
MELLYKGKTKDVYQLEDGNLQLKFKDDVTGEDGVFDPGANTVGLTIEGAGKAGLRMTEHFFGKLADAGVPTHFVEADVDGATMTVRKAEVFGKGLEVICRFRAVGSFLRRYGAYAADGQPLDAFVEVTIKDDGRNDPPISKDALVQLGILEAGEYDTLEQLTKEIASIVKDDLDRRGLALYDIKLEFGRDSRTGEILLIDEISGGNMRVYKDGEYIAPLDLEQLLFAE